MASFPTNDSELIQKARALSGGDARSWALPWLLLLVLFAGIALEWVYSPAERALGHTLYWASEVRPEAGRGWELSRESAQAMQTLGRMSQTTRQRQVAGAKLGNWDQVPVFLDSLEMFSVSPQRFLVLYNNLPPALQEMVVDPVELLKLRSGGVWQRVFFKRDDERDRILLVDTYNVVLMRTSLGDRFYRLYDGITRPRAASLDDLDDYETIVSAEAFFRALSPTGRVELSGEDVRWISDLEGRLERVGLAPRGEKGLWELGFEVLLEERYYVHRYWLRESLGRALTNELGRGQERRGGRR